jgi:hypothetical protein
MVLAATCNLMNLEKDAHEYELEVLEIDSGFFLREFTKATPFRNQDQIKRHIGSLHKAGLNGGYLEKQQ